MNQPESHFCRNMLIHIKKQISSNHFKTIVNFTVYVNVKQFQQTCKNHGKRLIY